MRRYLEIVCVHRCRKLEHLLGDAVRQNFVFVGTSACRVVHFPVQIKFALDKRDSQPLEG